MLELNKEQKKKLIEQIAKKYGLTMLLLFGSRVDGTFRKDSDFDIAYLSKKKLDFLQEAKLSMALSPVCENENIDLSNLETASPLLLYGIFQNCRMLFVDDPYRFYSMRVYAFKQYVEAQPLFELKFQRLQEKIKSYQL
ncbi:hypothetical protein COX24_01050 [bacterium (Candidatus Gribaldobacteria) CG23_combo_of_CG06-09_8_20_14_all_37_87_8]|uniref:Polymerase beta nucleotidyltransferase domain-containing protein n=2 Tax=Candidatus Gribaldobacteria TaxID=2798536 RepID=A0A2G9ZFF7_9BACT|nr:MAG: hypothetical protein AUJ25_03230 [Parcubacteria group bacterium CG1_02_37_13]PIP31894.1 MAG: hypothetical protein COX24_01050 [bacterium (Candidatus Gribaldobacteria) CG23_combo_of_CG06-09_8_20_14_all_37_87_8]PIR90215.1 MAG: hypothetical protein COU05_02950 [bacterium (Candidatus Gribaldobacteria) CG10_big_fil_rev_8_21_14_0_10_37_21]